MTEDWIDGTECTLPSADQPLRVAEFDTVVAEAVQQVEVVSSTTTRLTLEGPPGLGARVRDLTERESACCSFFAFSVSAAPAASVASVDSVDSVASDRADEVLSLVITVQPRHAAVLAALTARAAALAGVTAGVRAGVTA